MKKIAVCDSSKVALRGSSGRISLHGLTAALNRPLLLGTLWLLAISHLAWVFTRLPARTNKIDFGYYYVGSAALHRGLDPYMVDLKPLSEKLGLDLDSPIRFAETPTFLLAIRPLALLPPATAYWLWWSMSFGALCLSLILLLRRVGAGALTLGAFMLLYSPLTEHLLLGQSQIFVLLLLTVFLLALEGQNDILAGSMYALAGALRAYPLTMGAYLLLTRRWRALLVSIAGFAIITSVAFWVIGWRLTVSWVNSVSAAVGYGLNPEDIAINAFVSRFFWYFFGSTLRGLLEACRYAAIVAAQLTLLTLSARATLRCPHRWSFSVWVSTTILLSPIAWTHFLILLFIPFCELAAAANQKLCSGRAIWAMIASYALTTALYIVMSLMPTDRAFRAWVWIGQGLAISALFAYVSTYWLAIDSADLLRQNGPQHFVGVPASAPGR